MSEYSGVAGTGVGFWGMLTILFIGLKIAGIVNWSWWLVLSPMWISAIVVIIMIIFGGILLSLFKD